MRMASRFFTGVGPDQRRIAFFFPLFALIVVIADHRGVFFEPVTDVRKVEEPVLPESEIDKSSFDAGHHLGDLAKIDVTDHFLLIGSLDEELCQPPVFRDGYTGFVGACVDDDFLLHTVRIVPTFL